MPRCRRLLPLAAVVAWLAGCDHGSKVVPPEVLAELQAKQAPSSWEDLDTAHPGSRLRDPRTGIVFVRVPAGEFLMGGEHELERPVHPVRLSRPFLIAETEVTAGQWRQYVDRHGGTAAGVIPAAAAMPISEVNWHDAAAFCARYGYRLPTEAEWERACRGDRTDADGPWRNLDELREVAWVHRNAAELGPQPVRTRKPNAFGLYDMLGNLWEWTSDHANAYAADAGLQVDPSHPQPVPPLQGCMLRGGSFFSVPAPTPALRFFASPDERTAFYGFRPVASAP